MSEKPMQDSLDVSGKVLFAHQLRAVAAVLVLVIHLFGVYWLARDVVAHHIFAPSLTGPSAKIYYVVHIEWFNFGPVGVALFFLVSGFVIPFSVAKMNRLRFLVARALRIYPTYIACLAISLLATWLSSKYWGMHFSWSTETILHNALLVNGITGLENIDLVNWSLAIEIKFYLIACLMATWITRGRILPLLAVTALVAAFISYVAYGLPTTANRIPLHVASVYFDLIARDLLYIPFMLIGTLFCYRFREQITTNQLVVYSLLLFAVFTAIWPSTVLKNQFPEVPVNYFYALCIFSTAYAYRKHFRPIKAVDWLASISYPLYAVHPLVGYATVRFLTSAGITYYLAAAITIAFILALAYLVHRLVELPTVALGKKIAKAKAILPAYSIWHKPTALSSGEVSSDTDPKSDARRHHDATNNQVIQSR